MIGNDDEHISKKVKCDSDEAHQSPNPKDQRGNIPSQLVSTTIPTPRKHYVRENRQKYKEENPNLSYQDITYNLGKKWDELSKELKQVIKFILKN